MGILDHLDVLLAGSDAPDDSGTSDDASLFYECRRCGTTVESADDPCPACGHEEIAEYSLK